MPKLLLTILFLFCLSLFPSSVDAGSSDNIVGWAWSSNIGWISFNCTNTSSCASVDYGVNLNEDNTITGYAWSSNIGWIQFGGLSGFPSAIGTVAANAYVGDSVAGWARALSYTDGWDGWISLLTGELGVNLVGDNFMGYAWGSSVMGWIKFDSQESDGVRLSSEVAQLTALVSGSVIDGTTVPFGSEVLLKYAITDISVMCDLAKTSAGGSSFAQVSGLNGPGVVNTGSLASGDYAFELSCTDGSSAEVSFTVGSAPAGFTLGSSENIEIVFGSSGGADSETKTVSINSVGGFTGDVTLSFTDISPALPSGVTVLYSFNGGAFEANPSVVIAHNSSASFVVRVSEKITSSYTITLTGASAGQPDSTKQYTLTPTNTIPKYEEY